jgi:polar amino acid transport system substrate-binding protein
MDTTTVLYMALAVLLIMLCVIQKRRSRLKKRIEAKVQMFKKAFNISEDAVLVLSCDNRILYANTTLKKLFDLPEGYEKNLLYPMPKIKTKEAWVPLDHFLQALEKNSNEKMYSFPQTILLTGKNHRCRIPANLYLDRSDTNRLYSEWCTVIVIHDLRKELEQSKVVYRHKLTNLPNQLQAKADLNKLFSKIHLHDKKLALALIDIDNFSQIRSIIGYEQSEHVLIRFGQYLQQRTKASSYELYHTFSNNFLISFPVIERVEDVIAFCQQIQQGLTTLYKINDVPFHLTASIGISIYPDSGSTLNLLDRAYMALSEAQKSGYGKIYIYKKDVFKKRYDEMELFNEIHQALASEEFEVYYQPIVRAKDAEVVAAEALIRWKHREYGYVPPDVFIPLLEKSGYIIDLGRYVLAEVLKQQKRWELFKFKPIEVSINMSLVELESKGFLEHVTQKLAEHQVAPELIKFEITEGLAMSNESQVNRQLHELKKLGVSLSLDDFGTGYTSFSYLKKIPADIVKIDKSMVDHIVQNGEDQRIVRAMIDLGHNLGMKIVVEGIETREMADLIISYGCDYLQGYYFGKPQPAYEFQELIRR